MELAFSYMRLFCCAMFVHSTFCLQPHLMGVGVAVGSVAEVAVGVTVGVSVGVAVTVGVWSGNNVAVGVNVPVVSTVGVVGYGV